MNTENTAQIHCAFSICITAITKNTFIYEAFRPSKALWVNRILLLALETFFQTTVTNVVSPKVLRTADRGDIMLMNVTQEPTCMCYSLMGKLLYALYPVNGNIYFNSHRND